MNIFKKIFNKVVYGYDSSDNIDDDEYTDSLKEYNDKNNNGTVRQEVEVI